MAYGRYAVQDSGSSQPTATFGQDFASRFSDMVSSPTPSPLPFIRAVMTTDRRDEPSRDEMIEERLGQAIAKDGDASLLGYVDSYDGKVDTIRNLMKGDSRNYLEAKRLFRDLQKTSADNQDALRSMIRFGDVRGERAKHVFENANSLRTAAFNDVEVEVAGNTVKLGDLFGSGSSMDERSNLFSRAGFSPRVSDAVLGEDPDKSDTVGAFVRIGEKSVDPKNPLVRHPLSAQLNEAANFANDHYDEMVSVLGTAGARRLTTAVRDGFLDSGGMTQVMGAVIDYAKRFPPAPDGSTKLGEDFVVNLFTSMDKLSAAAFYDPETGTPDKLDPSQKRFLTLSMLSALKAVPDSMGPVDFSDQRIQDVVSKVADVFNRSNAGSATGDLFSAARSRGRDVGKEIVQYIQAFLSDSEVSPDNIVRSEDDAREMYTARIAGPEAAMSVVQTRTGARNQYRRGADVALGSRSAAPSVDNARLSAVNAVMDATRPFRLSKHYTESQAYAMVMGDPRTYGKLLADVTKAYEKMVGTGTGRGGKLLAAMMAKECLSAMASPDVGVVYEPVEHLERIIREGVKNPNDPEDLAIVNAAKTAHVTSVSDVERYSRVRDSLTAKYRHPMGGSLDQKDAENQAGMVIRQVVDLERAGRLDEARAILNSALSSGDDYVPAVDGEGKPVFMPYEGGGRKEPAYVRVRGNHGDYFSNPESASNQKRFIDWRSRKEVYDRQQRALGKMKIETE